MGGAEVRTSLLINASAGELRHTIITLDGRLTGRPKVEDQEATAFVDASASRGTLALSRLLRSLESDLVVTYGWGATDALPAARLAGLATLHNEDGFLPDEASRQRFHRLLARCVLLRLPRAVVCPSATLVRIARGPWLLPGSKVRYIPNGVDVSEFCPVTPGERARARTRFGFQGDEIVVGTVGRLSPEKNPGRLVRAFAKLAASRPARLLFVGDGPHRERLLRDAEAAGIVDRITITGWTVQTAEAYLAMDVFALTSDTEQMPIVLLEAMATGLPVVATDVGDVATMVAPQNRAQIVLPGRESELAESLLFLADQPSERERLGIANRRRCEESYRLELMIEAHLSLYREHLGRDE